MCVIVCVCVCVCVKIKAVTDARQEMHCTTRVIPYGKIAFKIMLAYTECANTDRCACLCVWVGLFVCVYVCVLVCVLVCV